MKTECVREKLLNIISQAGKFSGKHPTLPILSSVLCEVKGNNFSVRATNLDVGIEITIPTKTQKEGTVAVSPQVFSALLANLSEKQVFLEEKNGNLSVSAGPNKTTVIKCLPVDDFPTLPTVPEGEDVAVETEKLTQGIQSVVYSASVSEIKPELSSVYIYPQQNTLVFVATDSFRLAEKKIQTRGIKDFGGIILPYKNAIEIARICEEKKGEIKVRFSKHHISFLIDGTYIVSRLIDGTFPDYKQIIPKEEKTRVVALTRDVLQALKITNVFANKFNQVGLHVKQKEKLFIMESKNSDVGESTVPIDAALSGEDVEMNINHKYLSDCIPFIHQDSIAISFNGPGKPIIVSGATDTSFVYLVMPMNR